MSRHTTFAFTLQPTAEQAEALRRHVGASRFAFNQCLRLLLNALEAKKTDPGLRVPWSGFDFINAFNGWKRSPEAGVNEAGKPGLPWRHEVCAQVFEEAAVDLGRALEAFSKGKKGERRGKRPRFPRFKNKATARQSFRLRNKTSGNRATIRVGEAAARVVRLPKLGSIRVRECTRKLRRMLRTGRAKILFATVSFRAGGRWRVSLNVEAAPLHEGLRHPPGVASRVVGIDRGLKTFAVVADEQGNTLERIDSPRPLRKALPRLRNRSRALSRKQKGSRNRRRARERLSRLHQRIGHVRHDFVHKASSRLAKTHGHLVVEDLSTAGLMRTRLARSLADSAWALFATLLSYKAGWYGATLTVADRFYPSTRRCSACGQVGEALALSVRDFHCSGCGFEADRDDNAAVCLAQYPRVLATGGWPRVAAKHAETLNVCGEGRSGVRNLFARETTLGEAERAPAQRPRRAVLAETVNTL